ncbi:MAG: hypothetical protein ACODAG_07590, partial [Myxococcota bacterium]
MGVLAATTATYAWIAGPLLGGLYGAGEVELPVLSDLMPADPARATVFLAALVGLVTVLRAGARFGHDALVARLEEDLIADLRSQLHAHLLRLPVPGPPGELQGELGARVTHEVAGVRVLVRLGLAGLARNGITAGALVALAFTIDPWLTGLALL